MSVLEVLIASSVLFLAIAMGSQFLAPALRYSSESQIKVELQQQASLALNQVISDLQRTSSGGISIAVPPTVNDPSAVGINRIYNIDGTGFPEFENSLQVYWFNPTTGTLTQKKFPPVPPGLTLPFSTAKALKVTTADLLNIAQTVNGSERSLARSVTMFLVDASAGNGIFDIRMILKKDVPNTKRKVEVEFTRRIQLRNT